MGDEIKVVKVKDGKIVQWYPGSEWTGGNYKVDAYHAGEVTIYFSETDKGGFWWGFDGHIYIAADHAITMDSSMTNGSVAAKINGTVVTKSPVATTVDLAVTPEAGYKLDSLTVTNADGTSVTVKNNSYFIMPDKPVTVHATFEPDSDSASIKGHSLLLSGEIGVMFKLTPKSRVDISTGTMDFTYSDGRASVTGLTVQDAEEDNGSYWFTAFINPLELGDTITATFRCGSETIVNEYRATDYIEYIQDHSISYSDKLLDLVNALQDYGHYMQQAGGSQWTDGNEHTEIGNVKALTADDLNTAKNGVSGYGIHKDVYGVEAKDVTFNLVLNRATKIEVSVKGIENGGLTSDDFTWNGSRYQYTSPEIGAANLDKQYTAKFKIGENDESTVTVSAMSYVYAALNDEAHTYFTEKQQYAMTAYYNYHTAAQAYNNSLS